MARKIYRPGARKQRSAAARAKTENLPRNRGVDRELLISGNPVGIKELPSSLPEPTPLALYRDPSDRLTPRKRSTVELQQLDPESPEYWEQALKNEGLTPLAGSSNLVLYVGSTDDLTKVERRVNRNSGLGGGRRVRKSNAR
jgi:hypothetical protein